MFVAVLGWLAGGAGKKKAPAARPAARLEVEPLESRWVPSAIRNLPGFQSNTLAANDDGSTGLVNVGFTLNFFGVTTNQVFVNNNGNITFNQALATFTPTDLNSDNGGIPIIAPFFADVDTRGTGSGLTMYGTDSLCGRAAFGVDWFNVGYFNSHVDKLNTFQLILVDRSDTGAGNFDIEFNYQQIQWETGDASGGSGGLGGSSAAVGYSNGTGVSGTFFELPGSHVNGAFLDGGPDALINQEVMATTPGRIHFLVRNGQVVSGENMNLDISNAVRAFYPLRYVTDPTTLVQRGNLTIVPVGGVLSSSGTDACLDVINTNAVTTFGGPITLVFPSLPAGVTLLNPTGFTASGHPFIQEPIGGLQVGGPPLRVQVQFANPALNAVSTFMIGFPVQTFAGTFDPTML